MIAGQCAERYLYEIPDGLASSTQASPDTMRDELAGDVQALVGLHEAGIESVAVQGQVSSMKTWLLTCTAESFLRESRRVTALAPQRVNRRTLADRLDLFGIPFIEHPGRIDLCEWEPWREMVGRVDERACSTNGCPLYPDDRDMRSLAERALRTHKLLTGGSVQLDEQSVKELAEQIDPPVCPHYLLEAMVDLIEDEEPVSIATYAKAFSAAKARDRLAADVTLLDESHTVAADVSLATTPLDVEGIAESLTAVYKLLESRPRPEAQKLALNIEPVEWALQAWVEKLREEAVGPRWMFTDRNVTLEEAFDVLHRADSVIMTDLSRAVKRGRQEEANRLRRVYTQLREVKQFFSRVREHLNGELDFVRTQYASAGETVAESGFRRVTGQGAEYHAGDVFEAWRDQGTHPAIEARWGGLLDHHIEAVWSGQTIEPGGDRVAPGVPMAPLEELRSITGAETLVGYSATHNEASDPSRPAGETRATAHRLVTAPLQLRSDGDDRYDYHGKTGVDAATPWFRDLVRAAKETTDARLAAVPINKTNAEKWSGMPMEKLELPDGRGHTKAYEGLVPHSRAAIGDKGLEDLPIDAVLCGVQVQSPADTARRLIELWELLAPRHDAPEAALDSSWRLLAQLAVSGTIQAAGRFRTEATNIVFERPELLDLAGYEYERLTPALDGFPGEFARMFEELQAEAARQRDVVRAVKIVRHLEQSETKNPTRKQYCSTFSDVYSSTREQATEAFAAAAEAGRLEYLGGRLRTVPEDESATNPGG